MTVAKARGLRERLKDPATPEGRLVRAGLVGLAALVVEHVLLFLLVPHQALALLQMVGVELVAGREAAIPLGLAPGTTPLLVAQVSACQDLVAVALTYPFFLYALERYHDRDNILMRRLRAIDAAANRHRKVADRFGAVGLYAFMLVPFLVNGPLVGAMVGRIVGMRPWAVLAAVTAAAVTASVAWSFFYRGMQRLFPDVGPWWAVAVTLAVVAIGLVVSFILDRRSSRRGPT